MKTGRNLRAWIAVKIRRTFGVSIPLRSFLGRPTIEGVVELIDQEAAPRSPVEKGIV